MSESQFRVELGNSGSPLPGVIDVGVPTAMLSGFTGDVFAGKLSNGVGPREVVGILGLRTGSLERGKTIIHFHPPGGVWPSGKGTFEISGQPGVRAPKELFRLSPSMKDLQTFAPSVSFRGEQIQFVPRKVTENAAVRILDMSGSMNGIGDIHSRVRMRFGFDVPYMDYEGDLVLSGSGWDARKSIELEGKKTLKPTLKINFGDSRQLHQTFHSIGNSLSRSTLWATMAWNESGTIFAGSSYSFSGRVWGKDSILDESDLEYREEFDAVGASLPENDYASMRKGEDWLSQKIYRDHRSNPGHLVGRLAVEHWEGYVLAQGSVFGYSEDSTIEPDIPHNWSFGPRNIDDPKGTGDRHVFGSLAGQEAFTCDLFKLPKILDGVRQETLRQTHHLKPGGVPYSQDELDTVVVYNGKPDPRFSDNLLSFEGGFEQHKLALQDEAHLSLDYPLIASLLTNSAHAEWYLSAKCDMLLRTLTGYVTRQRGVGRTISALTKLACVIDTPEDRSRENAIREYIVKKVASVDRRIQSDMAGYENAEVYPGYLSSLALDGSKTWVPYQQALLAAGIADARALWGSSVVSDQSWATQIRICKTIVNHGFRLVRLPSGRGEISHPIYLADFNGGVPEAPEDSVSSATILAGSTRLFRLVLGMAAGILQFTDLDDPTKDMVEAILRDAGMDDWDAVRYLYVLL